MEENKIIKDKDYIFDKVKVKAIINDFINDFNTKRSIIEKAIEEDYKVEKIKLDYNLMKKQLENISKIDIDIFNKNVSKTVYTGIGKLAVMYDGCSYITLDLILKGILTHNDIYLFSSDYMLATNTVIVTIINDIITKNKYEAVVKHLKARSELFREVYKNQKEFDQLIYIGKKEEFARIKNDFDIPLIYKELGNIFIYLEPELEFKDILLEIDRVAYENNLYIEYIKEENIEIVIKKINELGENDIVGIFTKNSNNAFQILTRANAKNIFINKNPFSNYVFEFDEKLLIKKKNLIY